MTRFALALMLTFSGPASWAAAGAAPESGGKKGTKKERLKELASLLLEVSDDEYAEVLKGLPEGSTKRPALASRTNLLRSSYMTLAAMEYHDASRQAPTEAGARYTRDFDRLSRDEAENLAIDPETLEEAGWFRNFLGAAALGGLGYLVYELQKKGSGRSNRRPPPRRNRPQPQPPKSCGKGMRLQVGDCVKIEPTPPTRPERPRAHCMAYSPACGYPEAKIMPMPALQETAAKIENQLASPGINAGRSADLRHELGVVYEQLAWVVAPQSAAPRAPQAAAEPEPAEEPEAEPTMEDLQRQNREQMEEARRKMLEGYRRGQ